MLGDNIRQHRKRNHLSQEELADRLGVSRQSVSLWENNQTQPTIENIVVLSKLLGVSADELLSANISATEDAENNCIVIPSAPTTVSVTVVPPVEAEVPTTVENTSIVPQSKGSAKKSLLIGVSIFVLLLIISGLAVWAFTREFSGTDVELSAEEIYTKISPSVVEICAESTTDTRTGTGFFLDDNGTVVTNYHVIESCQIAKITLTNGSSYQVTAVKGYDANRDIAILSTKCTISTPLSIRKTPANTGEKVYALGSSLGLTGSLSDGIVSAVNREVEGNSYIQTTAPISQGNSGGPLVDAKGNVVGIICASFTDGQNLNLAIPINVLNNVPLDNRITLEKLYPEAKQQVKWLSDYRFQYYAKENTYVLLFQLADNNKVPTSANGTAKIRIVNNDNITVYTKTHNFTATNFKEWIYDNTDKMYLATIYISPDSIEKGSTEYGTVYFEVYGTEYNFDECTISATGLPKNTTCLKSTCKNVVNKSGEYCSEHKCANKGCAFAKDYDSNYCKSCTCMTASCKNVRIEKGYHCTEHTCKASGCTAAKQYSSDYCTTHKCWSCDNIKIANGSYCIDHTCSKSGCNNDKNYGSEYCAFHTCYDGLCKNETLGDGHYCEEHTCIVPGCDKHKLNDNYCYSHS